jgi:serine/threonine protein kinase
VRCFLGGGGQGGVFEVELGGKAYALKWYDPTYLKKDPHLKDRLKTIISKYSPSPHFLWPFTLVTDDKEQKFGYLMDIRDPQYQEMSKLIYKRIPMSFMATVNAGYQLAASFSRLHVGKGMCYWDINYNNIFLDPNTGNILICDNDNATVPGEADPPCLWFKGFAAPEIMRGEATPNINTDLHSLSVLLFCLFMLHNPLTGKREAAINYAADAALVNQQLFSIYGQDPLFIFDPNDDSNRVIPGYGDIAENYWRLYPQFLRDRFTEAFTVGLKNPKARVRESIWCDTMLRLQDSIYYCGHCGTYEFPTENFFDPVNETESSQCWNCQQRLTPYRLRIGNKRPVMLHPQTKLYPHQINPVFILPVDSSEPIAKVVRHPNHSQMYGLENCSNGSWTYLSTSGAVEVPPGKRVSIQPGVRINFGNVEGEILL